MQIMKLSPVAALAVSVVAIGLVAAAPAGADCTSAGGVTLCSQGDVRGSNTGDGPSGAGPYYPYPCEYDYLCDDEWGVGINLDLDAPDIGRPNPPNRPNRPGGSGRGGGGRR